MRPVEGMEASSEGSPLKRSRSWVPKALPRLRPYLPLLLVLAVVAPVYDSVSWLDTTLLFAAFRSLHAEWLALAAAITVANIVVMGAYDVIAFRQTRASRGRRWFNGAVAFVWSNFLTFGPLAGPSVRFWLYRDSVDELASLRPGIVSVCLGFGSGLAGWGIGAGLTGYVPPTMQALAVPVIAFAFGLLATFAAASGLRRWPVLGSDVSYESALVMAALGWLDWGLAWAAFAACLLAADAGAAVPGSWSVFFPGQVIGLLSLVPGGFGGGDAYWILHLVGPAPAIVCAVLAYRFLYYLLPWALGSLAVLSSAAGPYRHGRSLPAVDLVR